MELLEYFYDRNNTLTTYYQRKFTVPETSQVLLYGPPASGKTSLVLDYLMNFDDEEVLYIDFQDPKFMFLDIMEEDIQSFIDAYDINYLVLDHYEHGYLEYFPKVNQLILISSSYFDYGESVEVLQLPLLDYEEFFSFQQRGNEIQVFNLFLRIGTLPSLAAYLIPKEQYFSNFLQSHFDESEQKLLTILAHFNATSVTTYQIYTYAKERYKISKDLIYKQINNFHQQGIIHYISDSENKKQKKLILCDFALAKYLSFSQNFPRQFETMIALSLIKHNVKFQFFGLHGYITEKRYLIYPAAFETEESFWKKAHNRFAQYKKNSVQKVFIITVNLRYEFSIESIKFEALPFYEWVVINEEN
jgi:GTPase SAR1 family protein